MTQNVRFINAEEVYPYTPLQNVPVAVGDIIDARQSYIELGMSVSDKQEYVGIISSIDEYDGERFILFHPCSSAVEVAAGVMQ